MLLGALAFGSSSGLNPVISSNVSSYNLFTALGSPATAVNVVVTINTGVVVGSFNTGTGWHSGSTVKLINNGQIQGLSGASGPSGNPGGNGGDAITLGVALTIDNTNGGIYGGGGGGGSGGPFTDTIAGTALGGAGGVGQGYGVSPTFGAAGQTVTSGGFTAQGGQGGQGSSWGNDGTTGDDGSGSFQVRGTSNSGLAGGVAGNAIRKNGKTPTWLGGNNGTQVKGTVS